MSWFITWTAETPAAGRTVGADPTPYATRAQAEAEALRLFPDRRCEIVEFSGLDVPKPGDKSERA